MDISFEKLWKISKELQLSLSLDESLCKILTALTAGDGFAFNRAIIFLKEGTRLIPKVWIGPKTIDEAYKVWKEISSQPHALEDLLSKCSRREYLKSLPTISIELNINDFNPDFLNNGPTKIDKSDLVPETLRSVLEYLPFVLVPLKTESELLGLIIADNMFNKKAITDIDIKHLELYAALASNVIERANLFEEVKKKEKALEKSYRKLQEAQKKVISLEKMAATGELSSTFAHELRNPVAIIGGYAENIYRNAEFPDSLKSKMEIILKTVNRMEFIIQNLSDYIRIPQPQKNFVTINEILNRSLENLQIEITKKNISIEKNIQDIGKIYADPLLIEQVFTNILRNSIDAIDRNGLIYINVYRKETKITVEFIDNGKGMTDEVMNTLFTPFHSGKREGLGLGLAVSKKIILLHNGKIDIKSKLGSGTTVSILFPVAEEVKDEKDLTH